MKNNAMVKKDNEVLRILDIQGTKAFVIDCRKKSRPKWVDMTVLSSYTDYTDNNFILEDINNIDMASRKIAYERFTVISSILPFITDNEKRCSAIAYISAEKGISKQTINNYLWFYLAYQNITALAPKTKDTTKELTADEKNIRWALNKYFYTQRKYSLNTVYSLLLKEKYCDNSGRLIEPYPTFNQFRYFYRKHKKMQNYYISRDGLKNYQRNNRPLLGNGVQEFACNIGVGMLDSTVCDIYLVNNSGGIVGRPILTACIDGFSGLCCGYSLSWEGGVYSLRSLMLNVIADKKEWCRRFGIDIKNEDWACNSLPATLVTDMGREYASDTFSQISDLGVTIVNLPPYRPELKGTVEKFFDIVQNLYKPHLKGKGVIETDYQERGTHDYRRDACLTMANFEKIILHCIIHYNTQRLIENYPYTEDMIKSDIKPYSSDIWNYGLTQIGASLIPTDYNTLIKALLPRTIGKFSRKGLIVNGLRYKNDNYNEEYLSGGNVTVAYNPEDVSAVWLYENGKYVDFSLIESRFDGKSVSGVLEIKKQQKALIDSERKLALQAKIDLIDHISVVAELSKKQGDTNIKGIRNNRKREQQKAHIDYLKDGVVNE